MNKLITSEKLKTKYQFSARSLARMVGIDNRLKQIANRALEISPLDFGIPEFGGLRAAEDQKKLYDLGLSKCDGYSKKSKHQSGRALDFYAFVDGKASWDEAHLAIVAAAFLQAAVELGYSIEWGGFWSNFVDMPHIQLKGDS